MFEYGGFVVGLAVLGCYRVMHNFKGNVVDHVVWYLLFCYLQRE